MPLEQVADSRGERVVARFTKYLNGPLGRTVLQNLDEGESFILQTSDYSLKVTKVHGRATVELLNPKVQEMDWMLSLQ